MEIVKMKNNVNIGGLSYYKNTIVIIADNEIMILNDDSAISSKRLSIDCLKTKKDVPAKRIIRENSNPFVFCR